MIKLDSIVEAGIEKIEYRYDGAGRVTEEIICEWQNDAWVNTRKIEFRYSDEGIIDLIIIYSWDQGDWQYSEKGYVFFTNDELSGVEVYYYENGEWIEDYKAQWTVEDNERLETEYSWDGEQWVQDGGYRTEIVLDGNGNVLSETSQYIEAGSWVNEGKSEYTYDAAGNMLTELYYNWDGSAWSKYWKYGYTYDNQGRMTVYVEYDFSIDQWVESNKEEYTYDANGNRISTVQSDMYGGSWVENRRINTEYDLSVRIDQVVYPQLIFDESFYRDLEAKNKIVRHDDLAFFYSDVTLTPIISKEKHLTSSGISLKADHLSRKLQVTAPEQKMKLTVYTLQGRAAVVSSFFGSTSIDLSALPAGQYVLRMTHSGNQVHTSRLLLK